jgi:hypothetical protein
MTKKLTDAEIKLRLVPSRLRWPEANANIAWTKLHDAVDALHGLAGIVESNCRQAEDNIDLTPAGIDRRRTAVGQQAYSELVNFAPFVAAEKAADNTITLLENRMTDLPQPPTTYADVAQAEEIRSHVRRQKHPVDFVLKNLSNPRVVRAVLTVDAFLSGLSDTEFNVVRERARAALHPVQTEVQARLAKALEELRGGLEAAKRLVLERCELRLDGDGVARSIREPLPGRARGSAKTAA